MDYQAMAEAAVQHLCAGVDPDELRKLCEVLPTRDIEWRIGQSGITRDGKPWAKALAYVTNRAIESRLDEVCGPSNWRNEFQSWHGDSQLCGISIRVALLNAKGEVCGSEWVTKWDGAQQTEFEGIKGGLSGAMKRAAVQWGIGRYLYDLPETWCKCSTERQEGWNYAKSKSGEPFYWLTPPLPDWALPGGDSKPKERHAATGNAVTPAGRVKSAMHTQLGIDRSDVDTLDAVIQWVTQGHYSTYAEAIATDEDASSVVSDLIDRHNETGGDMSGWLELAQSRRRNRDAGHAMDNEYAEVVG